MLTVFNLGWAISWSFSWKLLAIEYMGTTSRHPATRRRTYALGYARNKIGCASLLSRVLNPQSCAMLAGSFLWCILYQATCVNLYSTNEAVFYMLPRHWSPDNPSSIQRPSQTEGDILSKYDAFLFRLRVRRTRIADTAAGGVVRVTNSDNQQRRHFGFWNHQQLNHQTITPTIPTNKKWNHAVCET